jgi:Chaperonin 10 Kd subunit
VLFGKWSGTEVKLDGVEYIIMEESDLMGVLVEAGGQKRPPDPLGTEHLDFALASQKQPRRRATKQRNQTSPSRQSSPIYRKTPKR